MHPATRASQAIRDERSNGTFAAAVVLALLGALGMGIGEAAATAAPRPSNAILVDKKTNDLILADYVDGEFKPAKTLHATLGKVKGDKEREGDLKTPEGIYTFTNRLTPPSLKPKFGSMAFYIGYPNTFDQLAGRTGYDIMLHATNEPGRLKQDYDSEGCVVVRNEEIEELQKSIRVGLTPILIFDELTPEYMKPGKSEALSRFFESWVKSWETKDINVYIDHYHSDFTANGMNRSQWKTYKNGLNQRYASISLGVEDVRYYRHPKYSMVTFTQNYRSTLKNGASAHRSRGTKILYVAEEAGVPKIIAESFSERFW